MAWPEASSDNHLDLRAGSPKRSWRYETCRLADDAQFHQAKLQPAMGFRDSDPGPALGNAKGPEISVVLSGPLKQIQEGSRPVLRLEDADGLGANCCLRFIIQYGHPESILRIRPARAPGVAALFRALNEKHQDPRPEETGCVPPVKAGPTCKVSTAALSWRVSCPGANRQLSAGGGLARLTAGLWCRVAILQRSAKVIAVKLPIWRMRALNGRRSYCA
jgi:hypothetical protein